MSQRTRRFSRPTTQVQARGRCGVIPSTADLFVRVSPPPAGGEAASAGYGRRGSPPSFVSSGQAPAAGSEPDVRLSPHPAPQYTSLCHRYTIGDDYSSPALGICAFRSGLASRPQSVMCIRTARLPKTLPHSVPMSSRVPALRQPIPGVTLGLCFLGHPTPSGLAAWSPAPASSERAPDGFPCSGATLPGCRPSFRDFRVVLYAVSHVSNGYHVSVEYVAELGQFPFWACLSAGLAGSNPRRFSHTFVAYP